MGASVVMCNSSYAAARAHKSHKVKPSMSACAHRAQQRAPGAREWQGVAGMTDSWLYVGFQTYFKP